MCAFNDNFTFKEMPEVGAENYLKTNKYKLYFFYLFRLALAKVRTFIFGLNIGPVK